MNSELELPEGEFKEDDAEDALKLDAFVKLEVALYVKELLSTSKPPWLEIDVIDLDDIFAEDETEAMALELDETKTVLKVELDKNIVEDSDADKPWDDASDEADEPRDDTSDDGEAITEDDNEADLTIDDGSAADKLETPALELDASEDNEYVEGNVVSSGAVIWAGWFGRPGRCLVVNVVDVMKLKLEDGLDESTGEIIDCVDELELKLLLVFDGVLEVVVVGIAEVDGKKDSVKKTSSVLGVSQWM